MTAQKEIGLLLKEETGAGRVVPPYPLTRLRTGAGATGPTVKLAE
ncbi:hypothetical protein [Glycomyces arizonensis]|nr:hypothetical protein [Glycomyces arizonensis]